MKKLKVTHHGGWASVDRVEAWKANWDTIKDMVFPGRVPRAKLTVAQQARLNGALHKASQAYGDEHGSSDAFLSGAMWMLKQLCGDAGDDDFDR